MNSFVMAGESITYVARDRVPSKGGSVPVRTIVENDVDGEGRRNVAQRLPEVEQDIPIERGLHNGDECTSGSG